MPLPPFRPTTTTDRSHCRPAFVLHSAQVVREACRFLADGEQNSQPGLSIDVEAASGGGTAEGESTSPGAAAASSVMRGLASGGKAALSLAGDAVDKVIRIEQVAVPAPVPKKLSPKKKNNPAGAPRVLGRPRSPPVPKTVTLHRRGQNGFGLHIDDNGDAHRPSSHPTFLRPCRCHTSACRFLCLSDTSLLPNRPGLVRSSPACHGFCVTAFVAGVIVGAQAAAVAAGIQIGCQIIAVNNRAVNNKQEILAAAHSRCTQSY